MRFLLDHDVPPDLAVALRTVGHEAVRLIEVLTANASDQDVWAHVCAHQQILITCNRDDFLALAKATEIHSGLIILATPPHATGRGKSRAHAVEEGGRTGLGEQYQFRVTIRLTPRADMGDRDRKD